LKDFLEENIDEDTYKLTEKALARYGLLYGILKIVCNKKKFF